MKRIPLNPLFAIAVLALGLVAASEWLLSPHLPAIHVEYPDEGPFDPDADAMAAVDAALARADARDRRLLVVMGANWCHDSRGLARRFAEPRLATRLDAGFELVYVDAGWPREGRTNNLEVARRFGVERLEGTPNLIVATADGRRLNPVTDVHGWNDAASRSDRSIEAWLTRFAE